MDWEKTSKWFRAIHAPSTHAFDVQWSLVYLALGANRREAIDQMQKNRQYQVTRVNVGLRGLSSRQLPYSSINANYGADFFAQHSFK